MYWLFVTGIALDIAGAVLVLGTIIFERREHRATRGVLFPTSGEPALKAMTEPAFVFVGATLLVSGFVLQLAGYTVASGHAYFAVFGAVVIIAAGGVGYLAAERVVAPLVHRRAAKTYREVLEAHEAHHSRP